MSRTHDNPGDNLPVTGIVLAAGASRRLGQPKQLVELDGVTLLARTVRAIQTCCDGGIICVLGAGAADIRPIAENLGVDICLNADWREGLGASIRAGVRCVSRTSQAMLLSVCDQPLVDAADMARLVAAWRAEPQAIAAAGYDIGHHRVCGVPAIFPAAFRADLMALHGDRGAKALIDQAPLRRIVGMPNAAFDIDDSIDLARLRKIPVNRG